MSDELVKVSETRVTSIFDLGPKAMVAKASEIADTLSDVIEQQKLYSQIGPNKHIKAEGWQTLGVLLGILPKERRVVEHDDGSFEAEVELVNIRSGAVVGCGSSYCGMDEKRWATAPKFSRRSMAITRACGKAYKSAFGWIVTLKGYSSTPLEEMPDIGDTKKHSETKKSPGFDPNNFDHAEWLDAKLGEEGLLEHAKEISAKLTGRPSSELAAVLGEFRKK